MKSTKNKNSPGKTSETNVTEEEWAELRDIISQTRLQNKILKKLSERLQENKDKSLPNTPSK